MIDRIVTYKDLLKLIDKLAQDRQLIGPVARSEPECDPPTRFFYEPVARAEQLDLGFTYSVYSPKRFLFPSTETLFRFERNEDGFTTTTDIDAKPRVLVGVHPCDLHAIRLLDHVFSADERDEHYLTRREQTLIIGLDCAKPCIDGIFCRDMDTNHAESGYDAMLYPLDQPTNGDGTPADEARYAVVFGSDAGRDWLLEKQAAPHSRVANAQDERDLDEYQQRKQASFPFALKTRIGDLPDLLERSYDSLLWEATARRCYSCGSCNLTCPTCYCFDIQDENDLPLSEGSRIRTWDGCQLHDFALVAGDHNFRPKAAQRLRHRIYRKGMWVRQRTNLPGCVGCARCDRACTAKINSVDIYNQLTEEG